MSEAVSSLDTLRNRLTTFGGVDDLDGLLTSLTQSLEELVAENSGMAEELLGVYEQLGIVFEVTRKLPGVQSESEVLDLFLTSLRRTFSHWTVLIARPRRGGGWLLEGGMFDADKAFECFIDTACKRKSVIVERPQGDEVSDGVASVMVGPVFAGDSLVCAIILVQAEDTPEFQASDMLTVESLTTFCGDLARNHQLVAELRGMSMAMVRSLVNAVDQKDTYTSGHSLRVGYYAAALGRRLGLSESELQMLEWAALLHDVGKIGIRDVVLKKAGKLTDEEFDHIKEHPVRSHNVVREVSQLAGALDGILYHHERYDGKGYPAALSGEDIPLQARIIKIADVFDALTSDRSYRQAYDWPEALAIMAEEAGSTIDPRLQKEFDLMLRERLEGDPVAWEWLVDSAASFTRKPDDLVREWETV